MPGKNMKTSGGFTLIEAMVTLLIFTVVAGACYMTLMDGAVSWGVNQAKATLQQELRKTMERMGGELRQGGVGEASLAASVPADGTIYNSVTFRRAAGASGTSIVWSSPTQYLLGGPDGHQLLRRILDSGGNVQSEAVAAQGITGLEISRPSGLPSLVEVKVTGEQVSSKGRTINADLEFKVKVRN